MQNINKITELYFIGANDECQLCGEEECEEVWQDNNNKLYYFRACDPDSVESGNDIIIDFLNRQ